METNNSSDNHTVFHAHNDMRGVRAIETINSGHNGAVVNAQNHR